MISRAFSGRSGRTIATDYVRAAAESSAPSPAPYPGATRPNDCDADEAEQMGDVQRMQVWAGQSAALARAEPAGELLKQIWNQAQGQLR